LILAIIANGKLIQINTRLRNLADEKVQLQVEYLGSCKEFIENDSNSVRISSLNGAQRSCLPITNVKGEDTDDLTAEYFCSDIARNRAIIHFVEIFYGGEKDENIKNAFIISFIPTKPIKAHATLSKLHFKRRPSCEAIQTFCDANLVNVKSCTHTKVDFKKNYVVSRDRIYIAANAQITDTCLQGSVCCSYIDVQHPSGVGICPHKAPNEINDFPNKKKHDEDDEEEEEKHRSNDPKKDVKTDKKKFDDDDDDDEETPPPKQLKKQKGKNYNKRREE